jgi:TolB protein
LAFTVEHPRGRWRVHTANVDGTGEAAIGNPSVDNGSPAWSPDGQQIAFDQFTDQGRRQQVFVMNADGAKVRQVTTGSGWSCASPSWSTSGDRLLVSCRSAETICGMGVFSTGQKMPECDRRLFVVSASAASVAPSAKLVDHDGAKASFAPR